MFGKTTFAAVFCGLFLTMTAAPAQAAWVWDWGCWCFRETGDGGGGGGGGNDVIGITASNGAKYYQLKEVVPYTGRTHLVLVMDNAFFPVRTYAQHGDRVLFVNYTGSNLKVEATNGSWNSNTLGNKAGYLLLVQSGVSTNFRQQKSCSYNCSSGFSGDIQVATLPTEVAYWEDTLSVNDLLSKFGVPTSVLSNTLNFVAGLQTSKGITNLVTGIL
ncbi:hypothetical protein [Pseudooceanicola sp.]|uniref:hypothetical protein n=1 Tax=Pseudooceanicola sp. TaxID=1914328 RepID=UPI004057D7E0